MYGLIWVSFLNLWNVLLFRMAWEGHYWHNEKGAGYCTKLGKQKQKHPAIFSHWIGYQNPICVQSQPASFYKCQTQALFFS